jgi:hypothetical protein
MRVRKLTSAGDMPFGLGSANYYVNDARGVAQAAKTRLSLWLGQWFLNTSDGTPWLTKVLGFNTASTRDAAIRARIFGTPGVTAILKYASQFDDASRKFSVQATIQTPYGVADLTVP